ncbi:putative transcriptional regulator, TetR family [Nocardia nova SH22a]|uniref:Putative transcriptional regulator, TetR family n=1 Tax=Nocardia nova SH22a TaxID=1415166 RepID=W5TK78_9NOCA|nr:TetR/AcrR family transcriptional regulator [Nocardia nova]AHH19770.1 putative transcriptional regulator, TetR family [Nocardia nova SH22a]
MRSLDGDRTARARIRDEALHLFAERGPDAVTIRDIAAAAEVSPALVMRHYRSKDGLREVVDEYVVTVFGSLLEQVASPDDSGALDAGRSRGLAELVTEQLPGDSAIPRYLGRMLLSGGAAGSALFARLYALSRDTLGTMAAAGAVTPGPDPAVRAAILLVNDLAVLMLRPRLNEVLGFELLSPDGMRRWGAEVLAIYQHGMGNGSDPDG